MVLRPSLLLRHRFVLIVLAHVAIVCGAYMGALYLRFEFDPPEDEWWAAIRLLPLLLGVRMALFYRHHLFSGWWQYVGLRDVVEIAKSVTLGTFLFVVLVGLSRLHPSFPRSVFALEWLLTLQLLGGARVLSRLLYRLLQRVGVEARHRALIVGTGALAESLVRELDEHPSEHFAVGIIDHHPNPTTLRLRSLPVLGGRDDLRAIAEREGVTEVLIAIPSGDAEAIRRAIQDCRAADVGFRLITSVQDALRRGPVRDLPSLDELFAVDPPVIDEERVRRAFYQKTVLVLGAAGRIGAALATEIAAAQPRELLLFDRNESALYYLEVEFLRRLQIVPLVPLIGDLLDRERLRQVFDAHRPDVVVHAAGYTREELVATNAEEIRRNNLMGTRAVLEEAARAGVERLLILSMDEAAQNFFRCLHHAVETWLVRGEPPHAGVFAAVRFPSVLGSAGCAVTRLDQALERGEAPSVPSPDARVRILTARALVPLLLEATALAGDGDVLAVDAGELLTLSEVAHTLRQMRNLPEIETTLSDRAPEHLHTLEVGEPTEHPLLVRRRPSAEPAPCIVRLLGGVAEFANEGDERAEDPGRR